MMPVYLKMERNLDDIEIRNWHLVSETIFLGVIKED